MGALADVKHEWQCFRHDGPGERFTNHRERMQHRSRAHSVLAVALGILLLVGGVILLFMPGPGLLLLVFGLALIASHSRRLANLLDRAEPALRHAARKTRSQWQALPGRAKTGLVIGVAMVAASACLAMWQLVVSAYLLG